VKDASGVTSDASTPNFSTMMLFTFSAISDILILFWGSKTMQRLELKLNLSNKFNSNWFDPGCLF
jgi:hypothetical protein